MYVGGLDSFFCLRSKLRFCIRVEWQTSLCDARCIIVTTVHSWIIREKEIFRGYTNSCEITQTQKQPCSRKTHVGPESDLALWTRVCTWFELFLRNFRYFCEF